MVVLDILELADPVDQVVEVLKVQHHQVVMLEEQVIHLLLVRHKVKMVEQVTMDFLCQTLEAVGVEPEQ